jgi:APA family basic amino acid/polyamine antiporter
VLRRREPSLPRPYRAPLAATLIALAIMSWMVVFAVLERPVESVFGIATLALGLVGFALVRRRST